mmetsp:Transcript_4439/g.5364  ORF Transcript_4439/g.5364 Transcript_4439/m.5364 type:complete len:105 (-) Transcript_4439:100-414(-)
MNIKRKDSSCVCMNNEYVYTFGGSSYEENENESVERYNIKKNIWEIMPIKLDHFMTSQVVFKVSSRTLLLLGGNIVDSNGFKVRSEKVYRLFIDTNWIQEEAPL